MKEWRIQPHNFRHRAAYRVVRNGEIYGIVPSIDIAMNLIARIIAAGF